MEILIPSGFENPEYLLLNNIDIPRFLNLVENIYKNPIADIILNDEKLDAFPER